MDLKSEATAAPGRLNPSVYLKTLVGSKVTVKINSGEDYRGILTCLDGYMNIVLEHAEEYLGSQGKYGDIFVRGNNVLYVSKLSGL